MEFEEETVMLGICPDLSGRVPFIVINHPQHQGTGFRNEAAKLDVIPVPGANVP